MTRKVYMHVPVTGKWEVGFPRFHVNGHQWFVVQNPEGDVKYFPFVNDAQVQTALAGKIQWEMGVSANPLTDESISRIVALESLMEYAISQETNQVVVVMIESAFGLNSASYRVQVAVENGQPTGAVRIEEM